MGELGTSSRTPAGGGRLARKMLGVATLAASLVAALALTAVPANAEEAAPKLETSCADFTNDKVWQTSSKWGRARQRACVDYTDSWVRGYMQFQVDWPIDCTVSVGVPPSASGGCPAARIAKEPALELKTLELSFDWISPGNTTQPLRCETADAFFGNYVQGYKPVTVNCYSGWSTYVTGGHYNVNMLGAKADVKDDGDDPKQLKPLNQPFVERGGDLYWEAVPAT